MIHDLRFIVRDDKRILQYSDDYSWFDVPLVVEERKVEITQARLNEAWLYVVGERPDLVLPNSVAVALAERLGLRGA